jgi:hypothetical protein
MQTSRILALVLCVICNTVWCASDYTQFYDWLRTNNATISSIEIVDFGTSEDVSQRSYGRGVRAIENIPAKQMILSLPIGKEPLKSVFMSADSAIDSMQHILNENIPNDKQQIYKIMNTLYDLEERQPTNLMALHLLVERYKNKNSFWKNYIMTLPPSLHHFCTTQFFSDQDLAKLQVSPLRMYTHSRNRAIERLYEQSMKPLLQQIFQIGMNEPVPSLNDFKWALAVVWSRTFTIYNEETKERRAHLCPFGDMFNYDSMNNGIHNVVSYTDDHNNFVFTTTRDVQKGEQLFVEYSRKTPNYKLMMDYGFCYANNPNDEVPIDMGPFLSEKLQINSPLRNEKITLLQKMQLIGYPNMQLQIRQNQSMIDFDPKLMAILRIMELDVAELQMFSIDNMVPRMNEQQRLMDIARRISERNEKAVTGNIVRMIKEQLSRYDSTLEEDEKQLDQLKKDDFRMNCILTVLVAEKQILHSVIKKIKT